MCPQYWESGESTDDEIAQWKGNSELFAKVWDVPVERIRHYLVNWGYRNLDDGQFTFCLKGKAYSTDQFEYGNHEQFFDFLEAIGGVEPSEYHSINLPA